MNLNIKKILIAFSLFALIVSHLPAAFSVGTLTDPRDILSIPNPGSLSQHNITFTLPVDADRINLITWILIDMQEFTSVNEPSYMSGNFTGAPIFTVVGSRIRITGITVLPGATIGINGIYAFNPTDYSDYNIVISVSGDPDGIDLRNQSEVIATVFNGSITVSSTIEAEVGTLKVNGIASPGMFVTLAEDGTTIGTTVADEAGKFTQMLPGLTPRYHRIQIYGTDIDGRLTPTTTMIEVYTVVHQITTVSGIFLPPTISLDKEEIAQGEEITVIGRGAPNYKVIIFSDPPVQSYELVVADSGDYQLTLTDTNDLEFGDHKVYSLLQDDFGATSLFSFNIFFKVNDAVVPPIEPDCDISRGDLNCDSTVNLTDFSILLYYWGSDNAAADINKDSNVNLIDFSIMMFYWQI